MISKQFGAKASKEEIKRYEKSPQWKGGKFLNEEETTIDISFHNIPKLLYKQLCEKGGREPAHKLAIEPFLANEFLNDHQSFKFIWYGHSVLLIRLAGQTILIDPMLGPNASPIAPFSTNRFSKNTLDIIDQFPPIDVLLLTHDHYDHLDMASMNKLKGKVSRYLVALGTKRHLVMWGVNPDAITEFDWHDQMEAQGINYTFTPSRHFSGRGLTDRAQSLWGGWILKNENLNLYFSGDGGYGKHFKEVGSKYGPFDFAWMECGQYNKLWKMIHMFPEESAQAAIDANAVAAMPVHWGAFALAQHSWKEPADVFCSAAERLQLKYVTPQLGKIITLTDQTDRWWESHR